VVVGRAQPEFRFEAAEHGFEVGKHGEGPPHRFRVPSGRGFVKPSASFRNPASKRSLNLWVMAFSFSARAGE
jgi:hypothetical protein